MRCHFGSRVPGVQSLTWILGELSAFLTKQYPSQNVENRIPGPLLELAMSKKCTPLWREARFQGKTSDVEIESMANLTNLTNLTNLAN